MQCYLWSWCHWPLPIWAFVKDQLSALHQLSTGVPQGSMLGPLLLAINTTLLPTRICLQLYLPFPSNEAQSQARSVSRAYLHGCRTTTSKSTLLKVSSWFSHHQKTQALPNPACYTAAATSHDGLPHRLLQCPCTNVCGEVAHLVFSQHH